MKLEEYQKPDNLSSWLEKLLIRQQYKRLIDSTFTLEVLHAKKFYQVADCKNLVDIGCWTGVLSYKFRKEFTPNQHYVIDAVPVYLYLTKKLFQTVSLSSDINVLEMTIVDEGSNKPSYFLVDIEDAVNTSNFIAKPPSEKPLFNLPIAPAISCNRALLQIVDVLSNDCYLKMDIDGFDYSLIEAMLSINLYPRVLHFEARLFNVSEVNRLGNILDSLKSVGYKVPELSTLTTNKLVTIITSRHDFHVIKLIS